MVILAMLRLLEALVDDAIAAKGSAGEQLTNNEAAALCALLEIERQTEAIQNPKEIES